MRDVAAVVVTYNRKELLLENIRALAAQDRKCDIIVIDNHSTDGTEEAVRSFDRDTDVNIVYIDTGENLGGAGGFSFGIKEAYKRDYKYIWIMDDDCIPEPESLSRLFDADMKLKGAYGFLASKVLWTDGTPCKTNIQRYPMAKRIKDFDSELVRVNYSSFVSMFFKREIVEEFGLPIKEFFIWSDDLEYTGRISKKYPCYLCNKSVVIHKCKGNYGINIAVESPERVERYKYIYRNDVYVFRREGIKGIAYIITRDIYHLLKVLFTSKEDKFGKIKTILTGTMKGIGFDPKIEYV